jgi:hypothetical protein
MKSSLVIFKTMPQVKSHPLGEDSPNLVTLVHHSSLSSAMVHT